VTGTAVQLWGARGECAVRANWGRWIADCPACGSALVVERGETRLGGWVDVVRMDGSVTTVWRGGCWDCGAQARVVWPAAAFCDAVERLLMMRPQPHTRNWAHPETLHDLMRENTVHGLYDDLVRELAQVYAPGTELLHLDDERIVIDRLPPTPALPGPRPLAIGA
jgi:hypothetical protein